jgi:ABC-2 type transport system ATP-binding protein
LKDLLRSFVSRGGTALVSTHTLEFAEVLCDRMAVINQGRIAAEGTIEDLRATASTATGRLEAIFLKLTGGVEERELAAVLGG